MGLKKLHRRDFIRQTGLTASGVILQRNAGMINSVAAASAEWERGSVQSLYERGRVTTYLKSKDELKYIGMPVSGQHTGTLYLSGDGRLWLWDIFNLNQEGVNPLDIEWNYGVAQPQRVRSRDGSAYLAPARSADIMPLLQGFAIECKWDDKIIQRRLCAEDWQEVAFEATYPIATVIYSDAAMPVEVSMQVYSPFIPLDENNSGLPVTVFTIHIRNKTKHRLVSRVTGWLENKTAMHSATAGSHYRENHRFTEAGMTGVFCTVGDLAYSKKKIEDSFDYGTLCIACLTGNAAAGTDIHAESTTELFFASGEDSTRKSAQQQLVCNVLASVTIEPGKQQAADYLISWHTPNLVIGNGKTMPDKGRFYANRFNNAKEVAAYVAGNFAKLSAETLCWKETWYDSTLPYWFLDRTFLNISTLATTTSHRFSSGRYWAWEGVGACEGNCTHVWQYAQAPARLFPAMERDNRERVDLGISLMADGGIWFRGEYAKRPAIDGQAGRVLGIYREHQMSADHSFLSRNWEKIKRAVQFIIDKDRNKDGMEDTPLENTLDAVWDGEIAWIVGLCIAAVQAGELMAIEMKDDGFANICRYYVEQGRRNMEQQLFNGEYFIHKPDAIKGRKKLGAYNTSHIDQVLGQSWAFQVGMPRVLDKAKTVSALKALWKYNFKQDVGPYIATHRGGRPYALPGESGMIMNTNPSGEPHPYGEDVTWQIGYFHECMSGFEHQVASHMMAEGMTEEALILTKAIHDRYHAFKRNPFNEIECSDHYGRAMASYGTFITACGFACHGPEQYLRFAPAFGKEDFRAAFTMAEGWGTYSQKKTAGKMHYSITVKYGLVRLRSLQLDLPLDQQVRTCTVILNGSSQEISWKQLGQDILLTMNDSLLIPAGQSLQITCI